MSRWDTDREELVKLRDSAPEWSITWHHTDAQIRALDALHDLLEMNVINHDFYRTSLLNIAQIDTGDRVYSYAGLT